jgi:hypothetical protein
MKCYSLDVIKESIKESINQSINQSIDRSINQSINQSIKLVKSINQMLYDKNILSSYNKKRESYSNTLIKI